MVYGGLKCCGIATFIIHFSLLFSGISRNTYATLPTHLTSTDASMHTVYEHLLRATVPSDVATLYSNVYICVFDTSLPLHRERLALKCVLLIHVFPRQYAYCSSSIPRKKSYCEAQIFCLRRTRL